MEAALALFLAFRLASFLARTLPLRVSYALGRGAGVSRARPGSFLEARAALGAVCRRVKEMMRCVVVLGTVVVGSG